MEWSGVSGAGLRKRRRYGKGSKGRLHWNGMV